MDVLVGVGRGGGEDVEVDRARLARVEREGLDAVATEQVAGDRQAEVAGVAFTRRAELIGPPFLAFGVVDDGELEARALFGVGGEDDGRVDFELGVVALLGGDLGIAEAVVADRVGGQRLAAGRLREPGQIRQQRRQKERRQQLLGLALVLPGRRRPAADDLESGCAVRGIVSDVEREVVARVGVGEDVADGPVP